MKFVEMNNILPIFNHIQAKNRNFKIVHAPTKYVD